MNIMEAAQAMKDGGHVMRTGWTREQADKFGAIRSCKFGHVHVAKDMGLSLMFSVDSLLATDWEIYHD